MRFVKTYTVIAMLVGFAGNTRAIDLPGMDFTTGAGLMRLSPAGLFEDKSRELTIYPTQWRTDQPHFYDIGNDGLPYFWASIETIAPFLPNFRAEYWRFDRNTLAANVIEVGDMRAGLSLQSTSLTAYISPLNNWLKLDLGMQLRVLEARADGIRLSDDLSVIDSTARSTMAALYGQASLTLPLTGMSLGLSHAGITPGDNDFSETSARLAWQGDLLGIELGYRRLTLDIENNTSRFDMTFSGPYAGLTLSF